MPEPITIDQAAARLGISIATVRRRIRAGDLTAVREPVRGGFRYLVVLPGAGDLVPNLAQGVPAVVSQPDHEPIHEPTQTDAVLTQVMGERDHLRSLVGEQQRTIDRLTVLLREAQESARRLSQPIHEGDHQPTHEPIHMGTHEDRQVDRPNRPPWWRRWTRSR